jgi:uncharacterized membrane protein
MNRLKRFGNNVRKSFSFIPSLIVAGSTAVLVFFIHHIATSIEASSIIASVADETLSAVDRLFKVPPNPWTGRAALGG